MKPARFDYAVARTPGEALELLADQDRDVKVLAGGQSLIPMLNFRLARPELLVDITRIPDLDRVRVDDGRDGRLRIGATARQSRVAGDPRVRDGWPLLADAIERIGHPQIRNSGTVCGSLAHHDPAAELPLLALVADARLRVEGPGGARAEEARDFFVGSFETVVEPDELLVEVELPPVPAGTGWSFQELARRSGDFATVGAAVLLRREDGRLADVRLGFCGVDQRPVRPAAIEALLTGRTWDEDARLALTRAVQDELDPAGDAQASARFRRETAAVLAVRAVDEAWERCA